jgi:hypothetical protein
MHMGGDGRQGRRTWLVMSAPVAGIHVLNLLKSKRWMAGTSPAMTTRAISRAAIRALSDLIASDRTL